MVVDWSLLQLLKNSSKLCKFDLNILKKYAFANGRCKQPNILIWESDCSEFFHHNIHYVKSVRIPSFSSHFFPALGLNTDRYGVSLRIQSESGKIRTRKFPNTDTFHAVIVIPIKGFLKTINLFQPNAAFLYPLKTSENLTFSGCIEMEYWVKWLNTVIVSKPFNRSSENFIW